MADLISLARAKDAFPNLVDNSIDSLIPRLITAASTATERYCRRFFTAVSFDEIYDSDGSGSLLLRNFPVLSITRLALSPVTVLLIKNSNQLTIARALISTTLPVNAD